MKKKYIIPMAEVTELNTQASFLLPASRNGSTDESLSRNIYLEEEEEEVIKPVMYHRDVWGDIEEEKY